MCVKRMMCLLQAYVEDNLFKNSEIILKPLNVSLFDIYILVKHQISFYNWTSTFECILRA